MPFITPTSPPAGIKLGAQQLNQWAANNRWLWAQVCQDWDCFTGVRFSSDSGYYTGNVERTFYTGYFPYWGAPTLLVNAWSSGAFRIYVTSDVGEKKVYDGTGFTGSLSIAVATDATPLTYTLGKQYAVRVTSQTNGGTMSCGCDYLAIVIPQPWVWNAPASFADGYTESPTDLANLAQNQKFLVAQMGGVGSSAKANWGTAGPGTGVFYNGSFYVRNGPLGNQRDMSVLAKFGASHVATLKVYNAAGTLSDTFSLNNDGGEHMNVVTLVGAYAANTFARFTLESNDNGYCKRVTVGGAPALSNAPPVCKYLDVLKGNSGVDQLYIIGNQNLLEIKAALGGATATGFQFVTPDLRQSWDTGVVSMNFEYAERIHTGRTLWYNGGPGTAAYGTKSVALPAAAVGLSHWLPIDLNVIPNLPFGMSLTLSGVTAAYEVP